MAAIMLLPACKKDTTVNDTSEKTEESKSDILITNFDLAKDLLGCSVEYADEILTNRGWVFDGEYYTKTIYGASVSIFMKYGSADCVWWVAVIIKYECKDRPFNNTDYKNMIDKFGYSYPLCDTDSCEFSYAEYVADGDVCNTYIEDYSEFMSILDVFLNSCTSSVDWFCERCLIALSKNEWEQYGTFCIYTGDYSYK